MASDAPLATQLDYYNLSKDELRARIAASKKEHGALLLVHNYQRLEIQKIADVLGDSLALARAAQKASEKVIVLCGVHFMAESAKILNPEKRVLLPEKTAGCPMADMITADQLCQFKAGHPGAKVVCYVNSSAEVKAESDVCCTSGNILQVIRSLGDAKILCVPDRNLAAYARKMTGADIIAWDGYCIVHNQFTSRDVQRARALYPKATLMVHPECPPEVVDLADTIASTSGMADIIAKSYLDEFIIGTEQGLIDQLRDKHPDKHFYPLREQALCVNMKKTDLAKLAWSLETEQNEITVPESVRVRALTSLQRMVEL